MKINRLVLRLDWLILGFEHFIWKSIDWFPYKDRLDRRKKEFKPFCLRNWSTGFWTRSIGFYLICFFHVSKSVLSLVFQKDYFQIYLKILFVISKYFKVISKLTISSFFIWQNYNQNLHKKWFEKHNSPWLPLNQVFSSPSFYSPSL